MPVVSNPPSGPSLIAGLTSDIVTIFVGPEKKAFPIHKALLSSKSTFFRGAFERGFKEATDKTLTLAEDDPDCFARYVLWTYNQNPEPIRHDENAAAILDHYCRLFVLAEKLGSESLQNVCLDIIREYAASDEISHFDAATINFVWENTPDGSTLRTLLIDMVGWQMHVDTIADIMKAKPEFLHGVLRICSDRLGSRPDIEKSPFGFPRCGTYHIHRDPDGPCQEVEEVKPRRESMKADAPSGGRMLTRTPDAAFGFGPFANQHAGGLFNTGS